MNKLSYALAALILTMNSLHTTAHLKQDTLMRDTVMLEEVEVSTGYQTIPAERATGSFESVGEKLFNRQISTDLLSRLDGLMPSVLFDKRRASDVLRVRGLNSIGATETRPLIVLDNFPYEGDINSINPNDVASVTLLKDAASASIWGARAGNGVLVISTKKGQYNQPFRLSATSNITVQEKPDLFYRPQVAATDYIDIEKMLFDQGVYDSKLSNTRTWPVVTPVVDILDAQRRGLLTEEEANAKINALRGVDLRNELTRYFYREAIMQQYALSLRGGSNRVNTLFSAGFDRNLQSERGNGYTRTTVRNQTSLRPMDKLTLDIGIAYTTSNRQSNHPGPVSMGINSTTIYPYAALMDENGVSAAIAKGRRIGYADTAGMGRLLDWHYRPYDELSLGDNSSKTQTLLFNFSTRYQWNPHLSIEARGQYENQQTDARQLYDEHSYYVRDLINSYTQLVGDDAIRPIPLGAMLGGDRSHLQSYGLRGQANYRRDWSLHSIAAIAGGEVRHTGIESNRDMLYGYDADLRISQGVDYISRFPQYTNGSLMSIPYQVFGLGTVTRFVSLYGNASYTLANRYTVSASVRRDASNLFGVATNNKWSPFWSAGMAWNIANERFYRWSAVPHLKLRTTYGHAGNTDNDRPAVTTINYRGVTSLGRFPYAIISNPPNKELRWEDVATWNVGLDLATLNHTFGGSLEYYIKTASDLIAPVQADRTSGFSSFSRNSAVLRNYGFDISLYGRHGDNRFSWSWDAILSHTRNKVMEYYFTTLSFSNSVGSGTTVSPFVGRPAYALISYRFAGLDPETGDPLGYLDGEVSKDYTGISQRASQSDVVLHGTAMPSYFGSLRNTLRWKDLSVSANVTVRFGYFFRRNTVSYYPILSGDIINIHGDYYKRWRQTGDEMHTNVPSMRIPGSSRRDGFYRDSEATVERGDHVRLQDVNLSYTFNSDLVKRGPFRAITATLYARNLGLIWKSNDVGLDPDYLDMPAPRSISFGLSMDF